MTIPKATLDQMNDLLSKGNTIADIDKTYPNYDYWDIYWQVNDFSFLGKKRMITNRLKKMVTTTNKAERKELVDEANQLLNELYEKLKVNSKKLIQIDRVLRKKSKRSI